MRRLTVRHDLGAGRAGRARLRALCSVAAVVALSLTNVGAADAHTWDNDHQVVARHSQKCLDVAWASPIHAALVVQSACSGGDSQQWSVQFAGSDWLGDFYSIVVRHSGMCLDVKYASQQHGAVVVQGTCWGGRNQQWYFHDHGNGYTHITARHSQKCLDVAEASQSDRATVVQADCWWGANQEWQFRA